MTYDKVLVNCYFYFIISTYILSKLTLKSNRAETGEQLEIWNGRSVYCVLLCAVLE
jgi:hypothetical protein